MNILIVYAKILPKILPILLGNIGNTTYICIVTKVITPQI